MTESGNRNDNAGLEDQGLEAEVHESPDVSAQAAAEHGTGAPGSDLPGGHDGQGAAAGSGSSDTSSEASPDAPGQTELVALREEFESLNDRHLRLVAEFNNFKRRSEQERLAAWARAQSELAGRLVEVLDDLQRVAELDLSNATVEAIMEGIDLVERKFARALTDAGIEVIEPKGVAFDPAFMEAMMRVPAESDDQIDQVAQVFQKGYQLKGNLIRPARVSVFTQS
jgi:molecular chaperone GrpE